MEANKSSKGRGRGLRKQEVNIREPDKASLDKVNQERGEFLSIRMALLACFTQSY